MSQANGNGHPSSESHSGSGSASSLIQTRSSAELAPSQEIPTAPNPYDRPFDQGVVLRQSPFWPRLVVMTILGVVTFGIAWSYFAKLEQAGGAVGRFVPVGNVKEIQAPVGGIIELVEIEDAQTVTQDNTTLLLFDQTAVNAELTSLQEVQRSLQEETTFYRSLTASNPTASVEAIEGQVARLELPAEVASLARNRTLLLAENRLFRALVDSGRLDRNLDPDALSRFNATFQSAAAQIQAALLEKDQLGKQLTQAQLQLADARVNLATERDILAELQPLVDAGAFARVQFIRQQQTVMQAEGAVKQLEQEVARLELDTRQSDAEISNLRASIRAGVFDRIAQNKLQIGQIDSQLKKEVVENEKELASISSQIEQAKLQQQYQALYAPISGTVFDLQVGPGSVVNPGEVLLKIVPDSELVAEVYVSNRDIGFVLERFQEAQMSQEPLNVDVRVDSFPFSEFGDITGQVIWIGSDALPPDDEFNFARFPVKVALATQHLPVGNREIGLQSGMSVSANIKLDEDRRVINFFVDKFVRAIDEIRRTR